MRFLLVLVLTFCLSACGPIYSTRTELIPPASPEAKLALNECLQHRQACSTTCQGIQVQCEQNEAIKHVAAEVVEALAHKDTTDDKKYHRNSQCKQHLNQCNKGCENTYLACFQNVGGIVNTYQECVFNCPKA